MYPPDVAGAGGPPGPPSWDDEATIVWSPPDWIDDTDEATHTLTPEGGAPLAEPTQREAHAVEAPGRGEPQQRPAVEVEVRKMSLEAARRMPRVYEIWTKNRVYSLDAALTCIEVIDLASGAARAQHPFVGARLVGGQLNTERTHEVSFPLPAIGSEAVFQKQDHRNRIRLSVTSPVTRVILHMQRATVPQEQRDAAWGRITQSGTDRRGA